MVKFLGSALEIPAATTATQAPRKSYVDSADAALSGRIAVLENNSGTTLKTRSTSADLTAAAGDYVLADASSAPVTITLPNSPAKDSPVGVKKVDSGTNLVTVAGQSGATVDGDVNLTLSQSQSGALLVFDGSNWRIEATVIFDPGAKNFTYRGTWITGVDYGVNDVVFYTGNSYIAKLTTNSVAPTVDASDTNWGLLAAKGAPGAAGAAGGYLHQQSTPASVWQISHALGFDPAGLTVVSDTGDVMDGGVIQYLVSGQTLRLSFDISFAGTAYLS